jgi:hypothetical protein
MKTKHQTDRTSAEQQAAATYEQHQLAPEQHNMDSGMDEDGMIEEQHNMDLDTPGLEQHELIGGEHAMELEREMVLEQSREQLLGMFSSQGSKTSVFEHMLTCPRRSRMVILRHPSYLPRRGFEHDNFTYQAGNQEQQSMDSGEREEGARNTLYNCVVAR